MSHTMNIQTEITDLEALQKTCIRRGFKIETGTFQLFGSKENGTAVFLPRWSYPVVIKEDGTVVFDNYNGAWGNIEELHRLEAYYGLEKSKLEAEKLGYEAHEGFDSESQMPTLEILISE